MKTRIRRHNDRRTRQAGKPDRQGPANRDGSVIIVVLVLMMGLLFLGILLFKDSSTEEINAEYFADSAKVRDTGLDPDSLFHDILRQIILGANSNEKHSPFYGGRMSLLPTMYGRDRTPYNGEPIHAVYSAGALNTDQDYDGTPDNDVATNTTPTISWLYLNNSVSAVAADVAAAANPDVATGPNGVLQSMPDPDVPWTYPDHQSMFLSYQGLAPQYDPTGTSIITSQTCVIPSYFRPQFLRNTAPTQWYTLATTARFSTRPHVEHRAILKNGTVALDKTTGLPVRRFVSATYPDTTMTPLTTFPIPTTGNFGIWKPTPDSNYSDFDVDLDGDGINDSIYMDMDLGIYTTPDGQKKYVPIVSAKMVSLDALLNLNAHGNLANGLQSNGTALPAVLTNNYLHRSNQGVSRSEINPLYGLLAAFPGVMNPDLEQHRIYLSGTDPANAIQLANLEYWWLFMGRPQYQGTRTNILSLYPGKWGEVSRMKQAQTNLANPPISFPMPGTTQTDDNFNRLLGSVYNDTTSTVFPNFINFYRFGHPLDYRATGNYYQNVTQRWTTNIARHVFPFYNRYFINQPSWPSSLFSNSANLQLFDEPDELRLDAPSPNDSPYTAAEIVSLFMSDSDRAAVGRDGDRVLQLAPYNFLKVPDPAPPAVSPPGSTIIRRLFTTQSWDGPTFGRSIYKKVPMLPFPPANLAKFRLWEHPLQTAGLYTGSYLYPPTVGGGVDPLRPELRQLLTQLGGNTASVPLLRRLSVNGVLDMHPTTGVLRFRPLTPHPPTGLPADPVSGVNSVVANRFTLTSPELIGNNGGSNTDKQRQEWLARFDRQRMCRDIYTLLYLFGGGGDLNYTADNSGNQLYSTKQMQDMAQFAVNLVDAMDPDNVITKFEYDTNLSNGWNLDDDAYTDGMDNPNEAGQRGVVYGVEAQTLAFSEVLTLLTKRTMDAATMMIPTNHPGTDYDDAKNHFFSYVELQNSSPFTVPINGNWQIVIKDPRTAAQIAAAAGPFVAERRLTLLSDTVNPPTSTTDLSRFTIGTQDDKDYIDANTSNIKPSYFLVNPKYGDADDNMTFVRCAPRQGLSLDLMTNGNATRYRLSYPPTSGHPVAGTFVEEGATITGAPPQDPAGKELLRVVTGDPTDPAMQTPLTASSLDTLVDNSISVHIQLRRRQDLNRSAPVVIENGALNHRQQSVDNPWIVVDEMTVPLKMLFLQKDDTKTTVLRTELKKVVSRERRQPLDANSPLDYPNATVNPMNIPTPPGNEYILNSLGDVNVATNTLPPVNGFSRFTLWQPHFDRDFASAAELLGLPLYGPDQVTRGLGTTSSPYKINLANTAANYFLNPVYPPPSATITNGQNRWYRLFELLEVPDRNPNSSPWYVDQLGRFGSGPLMTRVPGKMCLNTMSHPALLAGLLDEQTILPKPNEPGFPFLMDKIDTMRQWWGQFLLARDGRDATTGYALPGVPGPPTTTPGNAPFIGSRPFRELNFTAQGQNSLEETVLRSLPMDGGSPLSRRRLFELGTQTQHNNWSSSANIDVTTRYRLLNKVLNNSTNRSNVFVLIVQIDFFEAKEVPVSNPSFAGETAVRIGAILPGNQNPGYKAYYVIDRSKALSLVQQKDLPEQNQEGVAGRFSWRFRQDMDFSPLILHKQRIK